MKGFTYALGSAVLTILVILLIGYGWAFFEIKIMLKPYPELFGNIFYQQTDNSLSPTVEKDDILIFKKGSTHQSDDVIMYITYNEDESEYKVEKVLSKGAKYTVTECSTCETKNKQVKNGAVIGKVVGKISYFGRFVNFFKQKWFLMALGFIGFALVILSQYMINGPKTQKEKSK